MKKLLLLLTAAVAVMSLSAAPVDPSTAAKMAGNFLSNKRHAGKLMAPVNSKLELKKAEMSSVKAGEAVYYIYTTNDSYVIVAGDDRSEQILAYGDYELDVNNIPPGMQDMLGQYKDAIDFLKKHPSLKVDPVASPKNSPKLLESSVGPLLTCNWDQDAPFWNECNFSGYQCYTGCPATSAAMVFYYWKYPTDPVPALPGYSSQIEYSFWGAMNYNHPALPSVTFDWDNMIDSYMGSYTSAQGAAVARLMHYVGHAERMVYGTALAGGSGVHVDSVQNIVDAFVLFGYDPEMVRMVKKVSAYSGGTQLYTDAEWAAILQQEMFDERPVVFCAVSSSGGGHAFNIDGYDGSTNKYHVNFGWSGSSNDWFALNAFTGDGETFNVYQQMVIGIQPPVLGPVIKVNPSKLSMEGFVEQSSTATIVVKGNELTSDIAVALDDPNGCFTIDATSVPVADQEAGKTITVTYAPETVGTHVATITLTNADAETKVVSVVGEATLDTHKPEMLPADSAHINLTQFRADWTDMTADKYVVSYTLQVGTKPATTLVIDEDFSTLPSGGNVASNPTPYLPEGWTFEGSSLWLDGACLSVSNGTLITQQLDLTGYEKVTVIVRAKNDSYYSNTGQLTVATSVDSKRVNTAANYLNHTIVLNCSDSEKIRISGGSAFVDIESVKVYAGELDNNMLRAVIEEGDADHRTVTGITDKSYTITGLTEGETFYYRVKALYIDGTESAWSNSQNVTLFENGHGYTAGDVDHDGHLTMNDVVALIGYLINGGEMCEFCADVNGDGNINMSDLTELIGILLVAE